MAYTGYKIITYIDVNPQSPTFQTQRTERVSSEECSNSSANWAVVSKYCETDENGIYTGYLVSREMDVSVGSSTYGEIRETKTLDYENCEVQGSDPEWYEDEEQSYCETKIYEPSHLEGNTGYKMKLMIDGNKYSPTHNQQKWVRELSEDCPAPNTNPQIEAISESCVLIECSGKTSTNGYKTVYGIDKNPYSSTYLSSVSETVADNEHCPNNCGGTPVEPTYIFTLSDGTTSTTKNVGSSAQTLTFGVISLMDGIAHSWIVASGSATKTSDGISVSLTENTSTSTTKTTNITLKQNNSNKIISIEIIQAKKDVEPTPVGTYLFTWADGTIEKNITHDYTAEDMTFELISTKDGAAQSWGVESKSSLITVSASSTSITVHMAKIGDHTDQTHNVRLKQNTSNKTITLTILQKGQPEVDDGFKFEGIDDDTLRHNFDSSGFTEIHAFIISMVNGEMQDFTYSSDSSWFTVTSVRKATANKYYDVITRIAANPTSDERVSTLTFTQDGTGRKLYIIAHQWGSCTPSTNICYSSYDNVTAPDVSGSQTANTVTWSWEGIKTVIDANCKETVTPTSGTSSTTVTFSEDYDEERIISGTIDWNVSRCDGGTQGFTIPYSFKQSVICHPSTSTCYSVYDVVANDVDNWKVSANTITWNYSATTTTVNEDCSNLIETVTGSSSATVSFSRNYSIEDVIVSGDVIWNDHIDCSTDETVKIPYSFNHTRYTGDTSGEVAWYDSSTQTIKTDTTWSSVNACPQGGTTSVWIWSNVENGWDDYEITINYTSAITGWINYARFSTKYSNRAKVDIYWESNCSGTASRSADITFRTPASQTILVYRVIQRHTRY